VTTAGAGRRAGGERAARRVDERSDAARHGEAPASDAPPAQATPAPPIAIVVVSVRMRYVCPSAQDVMTQLRDRLQVSLGEGFRVEAELGGGGMSHVFVAEDVTLGRRVVVKLLPDELSGAVSMARFKREISVAARLQHPHIVPLLSVGEMDGLPYYTMPFVEGESLRSRLARGELPIADVVTILRDVARALEYAHGKGIAHRDIKPDNVLLAGKSAVITDFGVAKALSEATMGTGLTSAGIALGTPSYMAPEQAAGDPATDARADVYAFGVTAYEMLAGHAPFAGRNTQAVLAAHATEIPPPIRSARPATPPALAELVMRCLEKRPADRPQSAEEILDVLVGIVPTGGSMAGRWTGAQTPDRGRARRRLAVVAVGIVALVVAGTIAVRRRSAAGEDAARSIAVLPFENASHDSAFAYLEDGITDHVRDALHAIPGLTVKARSSSRGFTGRDARGIGAALGVATVLQGVVSGTRSRLHVTAELVRASDESSLWSSTFDAPVNELAGIQDTIARAVAAVLHVGETGDALETRASRTQRGTEDAEAYDLFLQGRYANDVQQFDRASALLRAAVARDPRFARAHAYLAMVHANSAVFGSAAVVDSIDRLAQASADRALALDSSTAEAYVAEAFIELNEGRFAGGVKKLERAVALDPSNADIRVPLALNLAQVGRLDEGLVQARRARDEDPVLPSALGVYAYLLEMAGQPREALAQGKAALAVAPANPLGLQARGFQWAFAGEPDSALHEFEAAFALDSSAWGGRGNLVFGYALTGRWRDAARERALLEREPGGTSPDWPRMVAALAFGDVEAAMTALERGVANHEPYFAVFSLPCDPLLDPLKTDPRFERVMARIEARPCAPKYKWPIRPPPRVQ
jgi:serine/threonine-protein kinase